MTPTKSQCAVLKQICEWLPRHLVMRLAKKHQVRSRSFDPWSHVVALLYAQLSHSVSLNDVCDALQNHAGMLTPIGATAPARNTLSHANRNRSAAMAEELFWEVLGQLRRTSPSFGWDRKYEGVPRRFKRSIYAVDATTIRLVANCMDWAKHRRRKAAGKLHMNLNLRTFLPHFAVFDAAKYHDAAKAREVCAPLQSGEIVVFDKAYVDYGHLHDLNTRGVFFVTRAKSDMAYDVVEERPCTKGDGVVADQRIRLSVPKSRNAYPEDLRRIEADVEIDGKLQRIVFISNNHDWAAGSICELYQARWGIEVFFKEMKQTLQLGDFLGHNQNAVTWQVWTALLAYILLRFLAHIHSWGHSFRRLYTLLRATLWSRLSLVSLLAVCGTASDPPRTRAAPEHAYLPGLQRYGTATGPPDLPTVAI